MAARSPMRLLQIVPVRGWPTGMSCRKACYQAASSRTIALQAMPASRRLYHQTNSLRNDPSTPPQADLTSPPLLANLKSDLKAAMRAKDAPRLAVLRSIISATNNAAKTDNPITTDLQLVNLLRKTQRASQEAALQFRDANRDDLAGKEEAQAAIMEEYINRSGLQAMGEAELRRIVDEAIERSLAAGVVARGLVGEVMKIVIAAVEGKDIDRRLIKDVVKNAIAKTK